MRDPERWLAIRGLLDFSDEKKKAAPLRVGVVGAEAAKFTELGRSRAFHCINAIMYGAPADTIFVSGGCHLGGVDIWMEEIAAELGRATEIHTPKHLRWKPDGYEARNLLIASADHVHCLAVDRLPANYTGLAFENCYHCVREGRGYRVRQDREYPPHIKSGGCWTMHKCAGGGTLHVINNY
jgi:hypothetical protein